VSFGRRERHHSEGDRKFQKDLVFSGVAILLRVYASDHEFVCDAAHIDLKSRPCTGGRARCQVKPPGGAQLAGAERGRRTSDPGEVGFDRIKTFGQRQGSREARTLDCGSRARRQPNREQLAPSVRESAECGAPPQSRRSGPSGSPELIA
jgi:hypothetical protein